MNLCLRITSNYWACSEDEYLFEFSQSITKYSEQIVIDHWYADETNGFDSYVKEVRKLNHEVGV